MGEFVFKNLTLTGQFSFITRKGTKKAKISAANIDIIACDSRHYLEQPHKYGVNVWQGAFTVYNFNGEDDSQIELSIDHITLGRAHAPVLGSGLFVSGFGDEGGKVVVDHISTGAIYSNGKLPFGTPDIITASVFIVYGVTVQSIVHHDNIVSYGVNDMVLDTWGKVDSWLSERDITSYGPSGIGFVNFGTVNQFIVKGQVTTYGMGARGYNQYDGTVNHIEFGSIVTHGDGSIAIQLSKKIGTLIVHGDVRTPGTDGDSLVKGKLTPLKAVALSLQDGSEADMIRIAGDLKTEGDGMVTLEVKKGGKLHALQVGGEIIAAGKDGKRLSIDDGAEVPAALNAN